MMTRDRGCFTAASSHVRVLLNYILIHAVSLSVAIAMFGIIDGYRVRQ